MGPMLYYDNKDDDKDDDNHKKIVINQQQQQRQKSKLFEILVDDKSKLQQQQQQQKYENEMKLNENENFQKCTKCDDNYDDDDKNATINEKIDKINHHHQHQCCCCCGTNERKHCKMKNSSITTMFMNDSNSCSTATTTKCCISCNVCSTTVNNNLIAFNYQSKNKTPISPTLSSSTATNHIETSLIVDKMMISNIEDNNSYLISSYNNMPTKLTPLSSSSSSSTTTEIATSETETEISTTTTTISSPEVPISSFLPDTSTTIFGESVITTTTTTTERTIKSIIATSSSINIKSNNRTTDTIIAKIAQTSISPSQSSKLPPSFKISSASSQSSSFLPQSPSQSSSISSSSISSSQKPKTIVDSSQIYDIMNRKRQLRRRRRGRLRKLYDMWNAIISILLLLIPSSLIMMINKCIVSLSKLYRYMIVFMSNRFVSQILWIIGIAVAITILPINLVNATSSSLSSSSISSSSSSSSSSLSSSISLFSLSEFNDNKDELEINYYNTTTININGTVAPTNHTEKKPLFPPGLFTREQLEHGAVIFYILGVIYMFVALAIVCDEFFVPSLDVIIEKLDITDDVAGATFMAAGGSAPELFTSVIGVFVSFDDVGIGTIVGSAVFNILFVIGMCALFSKTVLSLTWWPLFRDCSFYSVSLIILIYFFRDNLIYWWEALVLFFIYVAYVGFMKWNQQVERCVKKVVYKNKVTRVRSTDQLMPAGNAANSSETSMATQPGGSVTSRAASETRSGAQGSSSGATGNTSNNATGSTVTGAKFRHGLLQLMIHTIDPLHDDDVPGKVDEKATQLHAIASLKVLLDATKPQRGAATTSAANHVKINLKETTLASDRPNGNIDTTIDSPSSGRRHSWIEQRVKHQTRRFSTKGNDLEDEPEALSMSWPDTGRKRITYLLVAPIVFPLWLTLPDTRTPRGKKYFPVTFIGSIVWIAAYSYLMVWWANVAGDTARIPPEVMGLTFLAAGTSIPDLITSVIVARKGFGDMAVSSSVGSNIFDVTVGLPIPWLLYGIIYQQPVEVNSVGMVCSITILFMMLLFVVMSIACFRWRMNKGLGLTMFCLYFVFVAVSLMFEYKIITCPV